MTPTMSPRVIIRLVGLLFLLVGWLMLRTGSLDPAPRDSWRFETTRVTAFHFTDTAKAGRRFQLDVTDSEHGFAKDHTQKIPGLEQRLRDALRPDTEVEIGYVPRGPDGGWEPATPQPRPILVLRCGDEVLIDRDRDAPAMAGILEWVVRGCGGLGLAIGALMVLWTLRRRTGTPQS